jgi:uncharacterized protein with PIN domain
VAKFHTATFRFHGSLNFFLPIGRRDIGFSHEFDESPSIKDMIESLGVPHAEIGLILANGEPVDFSYHVKNTDSIEVFPGTDKLADEPRFVLDVHLGRLAAYLRMMGFDTLYRNDYDDPELAQISSSEDRVLLTRDTGLLKRSMVKPGYGYYVRTTEPAKQIAEVLRQFKLNEFQHRPFYRCLQCNSLLESVEKDAIVDRLPLKTREYYDEFRICRACDKIYWKGSHYQKMQALIEQVLAAEGSEKQ